MSLRRMDESARLAVRRQAVRTALQSVRVRLASTDAFLLRARRAEFSPSADELAARLGEGRHALRQATELTGDTPQQTGRLAEANRLLDARQAIIAHLAGARPAARDSMAFSDSLARINARLGAALDSVEAHEDAMITSRLTDQALAARLSGLATLALMVIGAGIGVVAHRSIRRDMERRAAAEAALRASEAKFAGILSIAAEAIISVDEQQHIVHFNQGAAEIFRYDPAEMIGKPLELLLPMRSRGIHAREVAAFGASAESARRMGKRREIAGRRSTGEEFPAEASISKLQSDGHILYTVVLRDVSERKRLEERQRFLAEASAALATSLDVQTTLDAVARLAVPALCDACVLEAWSEDGEDEAARTVAAAGSPDRRDTLRERYLAGRHAPGAGVIASVRRTGKSKHVSISDGPPPAESPTSEFARMLQDVGACCALVIPVRARGSVLGALTLVSWNREFDDFDMEFAGEFARRAALALDNARLYHASRRASLARDEVLSVVSHDLRNPLSGISMCASVLLDPEPAPTESVRSMAEVIRESAQWMGRIIQDLLDVSRIESGRLPLERGSVSVASVLDAIEDLMRIQVDNAGVQLVIERSGHLPALDADRERVLQVLMNLLGNAVKFTPTGGRITLDAALVDGPTDEGRADEQGSFIRFRVRDTGVGIAESHLPHVFDRFWQVHVTGRAGAGLGLAIAKGIVEAHGGAIWAESTLGEGTTFAFTIPAVAAGS
ncbi:MAG TPA: ATP-binding protein [Gemmatimonadaceae bacterium]|nr:ATP-binding protein [Gemmatimonadaceae bacterium]